MASIHTIGITGGTGFVGSHLVARLAASGYQVRVLSRRPHRHRELNLLSSVELVECDIYQPRQLRTKLEGCDALINLVGILNESHHQRFRLTHVALPAKLVEICKQLKIHRFLHMSALNADFAAPSQYLKSKGEGENLVHTTSGGKLNVTSFRPSIIFGPGDSFLNRFVGLLKIAPGILPLACGKSVLSPVYVGDVADLMVKSLGDVQTFGKRIELCGPEEYTLKSLVEFAASCTHQEKKVISLPSWMSKSQAVVMGALPGKLFTLDNYNSLKVNSVCRHREKGGTPLEVIAPQYLGKSGHEAQMQHYRQDYSGYSS